MHLQSPGRSEEALPEMHPEAVKDFLAMKVSKYSSESPGNPVEITPLKPTFWSGELEKEIIAVTRRNWDQSGLAIGEWFKFAQHVLGSGTVINCP
jgi:hypothetical protein